MQPVAQRRSAWIYARGRATVAGNQCPYRDRSTEPAADTVVSITASHRPLRLERLHTQGLQTVTRRATGRAFAPTDRREATGRTALRLH
jgi:hypothetical protein